MSAFACTDGGLVTVLTIGVCIGLFVGLTVVAVLRSIDFRKGNP